MKFNINVHVYINLKNDFLEPILVANGLGLQSKSCWKHKNWYFADEQIYSFNIDNMLYKY